MGDRATAVLTIAISSALTAINEIHDIIFGGAAPSYANAETLLGWSDAGDEGGLVNFTIEELNYASDPNNFSALSALGIPFSVWYESGGNYDSGDFSFSYNQDGVYECTEGGEVSAYELLELIKKATSLEQIKKDTAALESKYHFDFDLQRQLDEHKQKNANGQYFVAVEVIQELSKKPEAV